MKTNWKVLLLGCLLAAWVNRAAAEPYAYVANSHGGAISVIDIGTNTVLALTGDLGTNLSQIVVNGARGTLYVTDRNFDNAPEYDVVVLNTTDNTILTTIPVGKYPDAIAIDPTGTFVYVGATMKDTSTGYFRPAIYTIETSTNTVVDSRMVCCGSGALGLAVNPAGTRLYSTATSGVVLSYVEVFDTSNHESMTQTTLHGAMCQGMAINPAGTRVYVACLNEVDVLDTATNLLLGYIPLGLTRQPGPTASFAFDPTGKFAYVPVATCVGCNEPSTVSVIDTATSSVVATIPVGLAAADLAVSPNGAYVYVSNTGDKNVSVIDTSSRTVVQTIPVGNAPLGIGIYVPTHQCPSGNVLAKPDGIYEVDGDAGVVTDNATGLMWKRCSEGQSGSGCNGTASSMLWADALTTAASSSFAGHSDWRLPNLKELESLIEPACFQPMINKNAFPGTFSGPYWTSTTFNNGYTPDHAWWVNFAGNGNLNYPDWKTDTHAVRLVRGGRPMDAFDNKADATPNGFSFSAKTGVPRGAAVLSNTVTLGGFSTAANISIAGGGSALYSINGGTLTASPSSVMSGDTVAVQQTSASNANVTTTATLTVGGVNAAFTVTTGSALGPGGVFADGFEGGNVNTWSAHQP